MKKEEEEKENELTVIEPIKFLSEIEGAEKISEKFRIINRVLNQEALLQKNLKAEMKRKGFNAGKAQDFEYVPIEVVEEGLRQVFFRQVDFIIKQSYRDLNSFIVVATVQYKDPISNEQRTIDGIGAKAIQQDKNSKISDFNDTMKANGLELAVGIAYSRAIKNAAKKLGRAFGADLNRDEELQNVTVFSKNVLN